MPSVPNPDLMRASRGLFLLTWQTLRILLRLGARLVMDMSMTPSALSIADQTQSTMVAIYATATTKTPLLCESCRASEYKTNEADRYRYDVTNKNATSIISRTTYEGASYTHQGWVTDRMWQEFLVLDDEYDEVEEAGPAKDGKPITYFWDIRSLESPKQTGHFQSSVTGIDHNQFVIDGFAYQSNYGSGLRVLDLSTLPDDPTGGSVKEVGFFDIYPEDDGEPGGGVVDFVGTWSNYPFFPSGFIVINTIERGAYVVKLKDTVWG